MANRKIENLLEVYSNISMAREIAHATLLELSNNMDENNDRYIVLGVIDQLKIIGEAKIAVGSPRVLYIIFTITKSLIICTFYSCRL